MKTRHVISVSGGKDSTALLLLALERCPRESVIPIYMDTGNEHQAVYDYLSYLEQALDIKITRLRARFDEQIAAKRRYIAHDQRTRREYNTAPVFDSAGNPVPKRDGRGNIIMHTVRRNGQSFIEPVQKTKKVGGGHRVRWTNKAKRRALAVLHPTGNPMLDLCLWKGRFPSRMAQFCTEELKRNIAVEYQLSLIDQGFRVISWQGIRREESHKRRNAKKIERLGPCLWAFRPLVDWTAAQVFECHDKFGIAPNPLYKQGMERVGCMPCINCGKDQIREISLRFQEHIEQIEAWETKASRASKRGYSTFFHKFSESGNTEAEVFSRNNVWEIVEWAKTTRGGKQYDLLADSEPALCSSSYGLCE